MREYTLEETNWRRPDLGRRYQVYPQTSARETRPGVSGNIWVSVASGAITAVVVALILKLL